MASIQQVILGHSGGSSAYSVRETFESGVRPGGWTDSGTPNYNYTSVPLQGAVSLQLNTTAGVLSPTFNPLPTAHIFFLWQKNANTVVQNANFFRLRSGGTIIGFIQHRTDGAIRVGQGAATPVTSGSVSTAVKRWVWVDYFAATIAGNDGRLDVSVSTTSTKPGSPNVSCTGGTSQLPLDQIEFVYAATSACDDIFDLALVSSATIGSNPT